MKYLTGCAELFRQGNTDINQFTLGKVTGARGRPRSPPAGVPKRVTTSSRVNCPTLLMPLRKKCSHPVG